MDTTLHLMPHPVRYPKALTTSLSQERWRIEGRGTFSVESGTFRLLRQVDAEWLSLKHENDDFSASWEFHRLGQERQERFVVLDEGRRPMAAWLDHSRLVCKNAYRLDFFKIRPDMRGRGLGRFVLGLMGLRAQELQAERIVLQPLPKSMEFYKKLGATPCTDWKGSERLPNLQVGQETLMRLKELLDGYRVK